MTQVRKLESEAGAANMRATNAQQRVLQALNAEFQAVHEREAAEAALKELRFTKRQRTDDTTGLETAEDATADDDKLEWQSWLLPRWRKHEREVQKRRSRLVRAEGIDIDLANEDRSHPPRGDKERGWRHHWRRGLVGSIQDWAHGSRFRVAFMLAEMADHFECQQMVRTHNP
jgi:hypothetical protein